MKRTIVILLALALVLLALGCQGSSQQSTSGQGGNANTADKVPYKIGAVISVTGASAPLGEPEKKALQMEVDKINKDGGVDGHKIEVFIEDDQSDAKNANIAASKLIDEKGVIAIIGGTSTSSTMAMKAKAAQAQVPDVAMAAGIQITDDPGKQWMFRTAQSDALAVQKVIDYMSNTLKIKKFAILNDANGFGESGKNELKKLAPKAGLEVVTSESYKTDDTNMTSQLTKIKGTDAQAVVVWGTNPGPAIAAKNMKELGMKIPYIGSHGISNKSFITLAGSAADGVVFPAGKILVPSSATGEQATVIKTFMDDFKAKYGESANHFAGHAYDAIHIITDALKASGGDKSKLRDEIEKTKDFVGIGGIFSYSLTDHDGTQQSDLIMIKIQNGQWVEASK